MPPRRVIDTRPPRELFDVENMPEAEHGTVPEAEHGLPEPEHGTESAAVSGLFGRDMIYLAFWAMQIVLAAALTPATTRLMPRSAFGQASAGIAVMQLLNCLFGFGLYTAVQRAYAGEDGEANARRLVSLSIGLSLVTGAVVYASGHWWCPLLGLGPFPVAIRYAVLWAMMSAISAPTLGLLRSRDHLRGFVLASSAQSILAQALALGLVVIVQATAASYLFGQFLGEVVTAVIGLWLARPLLPGRRHRPMLSDSLRFSSALVPAAVAGFLFDASDRIVIHGDIGASALGRYAVARNIGGFAIVLLQLVSFTWMPRLFAMKSAPARRRVLATSRDGLYMLAMSFAVALAAASPVLLLLWAPASYDPRTLLLITALVAASALPYADAVIYQQVLVVDGRTRVVAVGSIVLAVVNLGLNLALVPVLGIDGSAAITCFCYTLGAIRWRWLAGTSGPATNLRPLALAATGFVICIASAAVPPFGIALVFRLVVAAAATIAFFVQLTRLIRPEGDDHWLRRRLVRLSLRIQFNWSAYPDRR
jgi:O-antigen/teichoic acid export membrane protein